MTQLNGYHIHVYFNEQSAPQAEVLREKAQDFWGEARVGRFHRQPVGPHTSGSFQVYLTVDEKDKASNWLTQELGGLSAIIHELSGDNYRDHTENVMWFGKKQPIDVSIFKPA